MTTTDTIDTAAVQGESITVPLAKLKRSPKNVRKTYALAGIEALAANIAAEGLLQDPVVEPELDEAGEPTGCYLVDAGERRRRALLLLAKQKKMRRSAGIRCSLKREGASGRSVSLSENAAREAMHPADEFEAFAGLIADGASPEDVAAKHGTTVRHVEQRMRLAAVSPALLRAYRAGDMSLDQLTAFAVVDDYARQEAVWKQARHCSARSIRAALLSEHLPATDKLARFVTVEAYEGAEGAVLRDLFASGEEGVWLADVELLRRLADEKLTAIGDELAAEGWSWVEAMDPLPYGFYDYGRVHPRRAEGGGEPAFAPEDLGRAGCVVGVEHDGSLRVVRGLVKPETVRAERRAEKQKAKGASAGATAAPALPDALVDELTSIRTAALRVELAKRPDLALAAIVHALAAPLFCLASYGHDSALQLRTTPIALAERVKQAGSTTALMAWEAERERWSETLPGDANHLWEWVAGQDRDTLLSLLAFCAAESVNAVKQRHERADCARLAHAGRLAQAAELDMREHWTADAAFFGRLTKRAMLAAIEEVQGRPAAENCAGLKADALAQASAQRLGGSGWLPLPLRAPATDVADEPAPTYAQAAE